MEELDQLLWELFILFLEESLKTFSEGTDQQIIKQSLEEFLRNSVKAFLEILEKFLENPLTEILMWMLDFF